MNCISKCYSDSIVYTYIRIHIYIKRRLLWLFLRDSPRAREKFWRGRGVRRGLIKRRLRETMDPVLQTGPRKQVLRYGTIHWRFFFFFFFWEAKEEAGLRDKCSEEGEKGKTRRVIIKEKERVKRGASGNKKWKWKRKFGNIKAILLWSITLCYYELPVFTATPKTLSI